MVCRCIAHGCQCLLRMSAIYGHVWFEWPRAEPRCPLYFECLWPCLWFYVACTMYKQCQRIDWILCHLWVQCPTPGCNTMSAVHPEVLLVPRSNISLLVTSQLTALDLGLGLCPRCCCAHSLPRKSGLSIWYWYWCGAQVMLPLLHAPWPAWVWPAMCSEGKQKHKRITCNSMFFVLFWGGQHEATLEIFVVLGGIVHANAELRTGAIARARRSLAEGGREKDVTNNGNKQKLALHVLRLCFPSLSLSLFGGQ